MAIDIPFKRVLWHKHPFINISPAKRLTNTNKYREFIESTFSHSTQVKILLSHKRSATKPPTSPIAIRSTTRYPHKNAHTYFKHTRTHTIIPTTLTKRRWQTNAMRTDMNCAFSSKYMPPTAQFIKITSLGPLFESASIINISVCSALVREIRCLANIQNAYAILLADNRRVHRLALSLYQSNAEDRCAE